MGNVSKSGHNKCPLYFHSIYRCATYTLLLRNGKAADGQRTRVSCAAVNNFDSENNSIYTLKNK